MSRLMLDISQVGLAGELGVTFQQVQKYEKGTNRISASRLLQIARILEVPVAFFFEGPYGPEEVIAPDFVSNFLASRDGLALLNAFMSIKGPKLRHCIVHLVEDIAAYSG
jgi:transcriptional regulator with XRE-family HTH domain